VWSTDFTITLSDVERYQPDIQNRMTSGSINNLLSGSRDEVEYEVLSLVRKKLGNKATLDDIPKDEYSRIRRKMIFHVLMTFYRVVGRSEEDARKREEYEKEYKNVKILEMLHIPITKRLFKKLKKFGSRLWKITRSHPKISLTIIFVITLLVLVLCEIIPLEIAIKCLKFIHKIL